MRALVIALCLLGCKKHQQEEPVQEPPAEPSRGHSITHFKDAATKEGEEGTIDPVAAGSDTVPGDAETADASTIGGNGAPARRDEQGHVHGPGGPIYMGRGLPCDASRDHCMRPGVWFAANNYDNKHLYRATPAFQLESKWYNWRGAELTDGDKLFKTELATIGKVKPGSPIIVWLPETDAPPFAENEYEALTSSRWDIAVVQSVNVGAKTFRIPSWPDDLPVDNARVVVEQSSR